MSTLRVLILTGDAGESLEVAAYPALEPDMITAGATFVDSDAVVDGEMVSARAWPNHPSWMREFIRLLQKKAPVYEKEAAGVR